MLRAAAALALALSATVARADPGDPVAVRWWGQGMISIETQWNLRVVIDPYGEGIGYDVPPLPADLVLVTHEHGDHNNVNAVQGEPAIERGLTDAGEVRRLHHLLRREAGTPAPEWKKPRTRIPRYNEVRVSTIPAWHDDSQGAERGAVAMFLVEVDGVRVLHAGDLGQSRLTEAQLDAYRVIQATAPGTIDVLCLPVGGVYTIDGEQAAAAIGQIRPRYVIPIHYKTDRLKIPLEPIDKFIAAVGDRYKIDRPTGNTLAVSAADGDDERSTRVVTLGYEPWEPGGELAALMDRMEAACTASQEVFRPLSVGQLDWRPPNGSHTARWNAEHMMGRQLGFFSQIYSALDPEIKAVDLNPSQTPPDYKPAHPGWDGAEEARQMQRSAAFVRRFAYLLDGVDLDRRAPGSRWTPRRLLVQMERHFNGHTANVRKKAELDGWPER
ncbi:MAG: MBL fold metallo-hydrolase [Planctomycetota bacterium]